MGTTILRREHHCMRFVKAIITQKKADISPSQKFNNAFAGFTFHPSLSQFRP